MNLLRARMAALRPALRPSAAVSRGGLLLLSVLALPACGLLSAKDNTPEPVDVPDFRATVDLDSDWSFGVDDAGTGLFSPVWLNGEVWAAGMDGKARSRADSGGSRRSLQFADELGAGIDGNQDMLVAASRRGRVLAHGLDGTALWARDLGAEVLSRPRLAGDTVFVRVQDGRLVALNAANGQIRWQSEVNNPALVLHVASGIAWTDSVVYAGFPGGRLRAFDRSTGKQLWDGVVAQPRGASELERVSDVVGDPWLDGDQVCAVTYQGRVACLDTSRGEPRWTRDISSSSGLAGDHRHVYVTDAMSNVIAYDKNTGAQVWKQEGLRARGVTAPAVLGRYVAVADFEGKVFLLDAENGRFAAKEDIGDAVRTAPVVAGEALLVQDEDGEVSLLRISASGK